MRAAVAVKPCPQGHVAGRTKKGCIQCQRDREKRWRQNNKERHQARATRWMKNNPEKKTAINRARYRRDPEKYRTKARDYAKLNRPKARIWEGNRRARKAGAEGHHTEADVMRIKKKQHGLCACGCGVSLNVSCTEDHIVPLSRGGSDWAFNIQLMTSWCNDSKGTKLMSEWKR